MPDTTSLFDRAMLSIVTEKFPFFAIEKFPLGA